MLSSSPSVSRDLSNDAQDMESPELDQNHRRFVRSTNNSHKKFISVLRKLIFRVATKTEKRDFQTRYANHRHSRAYFFVLLLFLSLKVPRDLVASIVSEFNSEMARKIQEYTIEAQSTENGNKRRFRLCEILDIGYARQSMAHFLQGRFTEAIECLYKKEKKNVLKKQHYSNTVHLIYDTIAEMGETAETIVTQMSSISYDGLYPVGLLSLPQITSSVLINQTASKSVSSITNGHLSFIQSDNSQSLESLEGNATTKLGASRYSKKASRKYSNYEPITLKKSSTSHFESTQTASCLASQGSHRSAFSYFGSQCSSESPRSQPKSEEPSFLTTFRLQLQSVNLSGHPLLSSSEWDHQLVETMARKTRHNRIRISHLGLLPVIVLHQGLISP